MKESNVNFPIIKTLEQLATCIGTSADILERGIIKHKEDFYVHRIPKKQQSSYRIVWETKNRALADAYRAFTRRFERFLCIEKKDFPHDSAYGYRRKRNIFENAKRHCGATLLLRADISNFFNTISIYRLREAFHELGLDKDISEKLALFLTIDGYLPMGLPASPLLSNLICFNLDNNIAELASSYDCKYSRYADDISISGMANLPSKEELKLIVEREGFELSEQKFRITKRGQAHYVTGLSISDETNPHIPRILRRKLRQELYYCTKYGIEDHLARVTYIRKFRHFSQYGLEDYLARVSEYDLQQGINRLHGMVCYVKGIEKANILTLWRALLNRDGVRPCYRSWRRNISREQLYFYFDEAEIKLDDTRTLLCLGMTMIDLKSHSQIAHQTRQIIEDNNVDPFYAGRKNKKFHYSDAHDQLRGDYIKTMASFSFRGYIAYKELSKLDEYSTAYLLLVEKLLHDRFISCDDTRVAIILEQNSKVKVEAVKELISNIYDRLESKNSRRPISLPKIIIGDNREYPCIATVDFLLATFSSYCKSDKMYHFERLRDKYHLIVDVDKGIYIKRKDTFLPLISKSSG